MKPFKFVPYLKSTIWGGEQIAPFKGIVTDKHNVGESWEISGVPSHQSVVAEGDDKGLNMTALVQKYKGQLVGEKVYEKFGDQFPLLIKFIDSCQDLSVQVHPNDELAQERHNCPGKTEMWYIIKTVPGARIYAGLSKAITPDEYEELATAEAVDGHSPMMDVIATHESHQGDLFFLPAGRLHSIGAGNFLVEIQETSDITYRVYDFGRRDAEGNTRELHIDLAKDAIDYHVYPEYRSTYDSTLQNAPLIHCSEFNVNRVVVHSAMKVDFKTDTFVIVVCLAGQANINGTMIHQGETILVPACENDLSILGNGTFLTATM
jgi:mannose-6-phosphate isomerase